MSINAKNVRCINLTTKGEYVANTKGEGNNIQNVIITVCVVIAVTSVVIIVLIYRKLKYKRTTTQTFVHNQDHDIVNTSRLDMRLESPEVPLYKDESDYDRVKI